MVETVTAQTVEIVKGIQEKKNKLCLYFPSRICWQSGLSFDEEKPCEGCINQNEFLKKVAQLTQRDFSHE